MSFSTVYRIASPIAAPPAISIAASTCTTACVGFIGTTGAYTSVQNIL